MYHLFTVPPQTNSPISDAYHRIIAVLRLWPTWLTLTLCIAGILIILVGVWRARGRNKSRNKR